MGFKLSFDENALKRTIESQAASALRNRSYEVECPHCRNRFEAKSGTNVCPNCRNTVDLTLDIHF